MSDQPAAEAWSMVESSPDGMLLVDGEGSIVWANAPIASMFGWAVDELVGREVDDLLPERFRDGHRAHRLRYRAAPTPGPMTGDEEVWARHREGSEFPAEVSLAPLRSSKDGAVVVTVRDASRRLERQAETHAVLDTLDAAHDGVFMFTADDLRFTYVNLGASRQLGYTRDELLQMTPLHIKPEFTESSFRDLLAPLLTGEQTSHTFTTVHRRSDGVDVPVEIILEYPEAIGPGRPRRFVAMVRDITDRIAAEREVHSSQQAFRTAFDAGPVGMAIVDYSDPVRRPIVNANSALGELLGYSSDELTSIGFADLTHPDDAATSDERALAVTKGEISNYALEKRYVHKDGHTVWVWVHSAVLHDPLGQPSGVLVHVADLTERRRADASRDREKKTLEGLAIVRQAVLRDAPLDEVIALVCHHARHITGADSVVLTSPDHDAGVHRVQAVDGAETAEATPPGFEFELDEPARIALTGETFLSARIDEDHRISRTNRAIADERSRMRSGVLVPVFVDDAVRALMVVASEREDAFEPPVVEALERFAFEASTAIRLNTARQTELDAAQLVMASEARFRASFDSAPVAMALGSLDAADQRRITAVNEALCDLLGYTASELCSMSFAELTHPDDASPADVAAATEMQTGRRFVYRTEKRYVHREGHPVWVSLHSTALPGGNGSSSTFLAHIVDISDRKQAEADRDRHERRLEGLAEVRAAALAGVSVDEILSTICRQTKRLIEADAAIVFRPIDDEMLEPVAFDGPETERVTPGELELGPNTIRILAGETFASSDVWSDERIDTENLEQLALSSTMLRSSIAVPIVSRTDSCMLLLTGSASDQFPPDALALVEDFADQASAALQVHDARRDEARLQVLEDRERLAADLHDVIIQRLFASGMNLQLLAGTVADGAARAKLRETIDQIDETISELRAAIFRLTT